MSSGRTWVSEPLKARPMGVRMASTITASGMETVSCSGHRRRTVPLRLEHELPVRRGGLALPGLGDPLERQRLVLDGQPPRGGVLEHHAVRAGLFLLGRRAEREPADVERLA